MQTKFHINVSQGIIDIEGEPDVVREIYADFKDKLLSQFGNWADDTAESPTTPETPAPKATLQRRAPSRKRAKVETEEIGVDADKPKLDKDLDTSKLADFYGQFEPKNNPEKILVFSKFLTEELGIESPTTDQIYTCYLALKEKIPKVFSQAFRDTGGKKYGYIDYKAPSDIKVTIMGTNHFNSGVRRKAAE